MCNRIGVYVCMFLWMYFLYACVYASRQLRSVFCSVGHRIYRNGKVLNCCSRCIGKGNKGGESGKEMYRSREKHRINGQQMGKGPRGTREISFRKVMS